MYIEIDVGVWGKARLIQRLQHAPAAEGKRIISSAEIMAEIEARRNGSLVYSSLTLGGRPDLIVMEAGAYEPIAEDCNRELRSSNLISPQ